MKVLKYIALFLIFIFSTTCTKFGRNITIKGKVVNPITGITYPDLKVQLVKSQSLSLPGGKKEIKHTFSDSNGEFEINASRLGKIWVQIQSGSDLYVLGWYQDAQYISDNFRTTAQKRETMEADFHVVPYGEYQLIVNNINCQGSNDTIIINQQNQVGSFYNEDWVLTGCDGYTTSFSEVPMGNIYIDWTVIRGGVSESFSDTVFLDESEELSYEINY